MGMKLDVAAELEAIGDVVRVVQKLGLRPVFLRPIPLLLKLG